MGGSDRTVLFVLPIVALAIAFWFLALAPKRQEASDLQGQIDSLQTSVDANEAEIASAEAAREKFPKTYARLIKLGRAVPEDSDQATFVYDVSEIGRSNKLMFRDFSLISNGGGTTSTPAPAPTPAPSPTTPPATDSSASPTPTAETSAPATEAAAAVLPIGAAVGPAGLPVMPYELTFRGSFFDVADFLGDLDSTVNTSETNPKVQGRLTTTDGFVMTGNPAKGFPSIQATMLLTTFIIPPDQGLAAGATPAGPAPVDPTASPTNVAAATTTLP
jgi:preprotein translocase subunit YajC